MTALKSAAKDRSAIEPGQHREKLIRTVHSLAGSGGIFGFDVLSDKAAGLETLLVSGVEIDPLAFDTRLHELVAELESILIG